MLGKPLRNSKISEWGMSDEKSKTFEMVERSTEHTQRVVSDDFDEFLCLPCTGMHEDIEREPARASDLLCDIQLSSSSHPTTKDTQEKTRKGERPENSIGNSSKSATAANSGNSGNSGSVQSQVPLQMLLTAMLRRRRRWRRRRRRSRRIDVQSWSR